MALANRAMAASRHEKVFDKISVDFAYPTDIAANKEG
jgi:hypothetical protein